MMTPCAGTLTGRQDVVDAADKVASYLTGDPEVYANPEDYFDLLLKLIFQN
jgi:aconitate hydratase